MISDKSGKYLDFIIQSVYFFIILLIIYFCKQFLLPLFMPFIFAFLFTLVLSPFMRFFIRHKIPRALAAILSMFITLLLISALFFVLGRQISSQIISIASKLPTYIEDFTATIMGLVEQGKLFYFALDPSIIDLVETFLNTTTTKIVEYSSSLTSSAIGKVTIIPGFLLAFFMMLISTFFMTKDGKTIFGFVRRQFSEHITNKFDDFKSVFKNKILNYLKAQFIILSITFAECLIGLSIIGFEYSLLIAMIVALVDIIPVLGTGTIVIPWAIFSFLTGSINKGIALLVMWLIILIVRYMIEPKIVGHQLGLHPIVILGAMYIGIKTLGLAGVILGPLCAIILFAAQEADIIPHFK